MPRFRLVGPYVHTWLEILIRIILAITFVELEHATPFERKIQSEEIWLYRYPKTASYVPSTVLWPVVLSVPAILFLIHFLITRNKMEFIQVNLAISLALGINGLLTDVLKLSVGRPRPDFFWRCFPNGEMNNEIKCTGDPGEILDGRKSFPSGHSSFSFASMSFITWYLMGKLHVFSDRGRGQSWRLCLSITPLFVALLIAISRTCDYHHHWQDVTFGSFMGISLSYLCYRQYYPPLHSKLSHRSYADITSRNFDGLEKISDKSSPTQPPEAKSFLDDEKETKWI